MRTILAATLALSVSPSAQNSVNQPRMLERGTPVEAPLTVGERHTYRVVLNAGEGAQILVVKRGIDVFIRCIDPAGKDIAFVEDDLRPNGEERVTLVADTSGAYAVVVSAAFANQPSGQYSIQVVDVRAATAADRSRQEISRLRSQAMESHGSGRYDEALVLLKRAQGIAESLAGVDDEVVTRVVADLANTYFERRDFPEAEALFIQAGGALDRILGSDHPSSALVWARLASLYTFTGQRLKAETLGQRTLDIIEKALGPNHPAVARCLVTLANIRMNAGDLDQAEALDRRALAIVEPTAPESRLTADLLNNLGLVYLERRDYVRADEFLRRSLPIGEHLYGKDSYWVASELNNLGIVARQTKDYDRAERYYARALEIHEKAVGLDHPDIAINLNNLAIIYNIRGNPGRALEMHFRALRIREKWTGPYSGATLASLGNIARTYAAAGDVTRAIEFQLRADTVLEMEIALNLAIGSERQKLAFADTVSQRTDRTISLNLDAAPLDPGMSSLAALVVLQRKGRVLDAMTDTLGRLRERAVSPDDRDLLDRLKATTTQLARLALNGAGDMSPEVHQKAIKDLEAEKEKVEAAISAHIAEFRAQVRPVTMDTVQGTMPDDAALVEFAVFHPFDPKAQSNDEAYGVPRYVAYVIRSSGVPRGIDLGPAAPIDSAVGSFRRALRDPKRADVSRLSRAVDKLVLEPIRVAFGEASRLLISPDGDLNLIPFEALVDSAGRFAVQRYSISYLGSGRDLLRMQVPRESRGGPVVLADPQFGAFQAASAEGKTSRPASIALNRSVTTGSGLSGLYFAPLAGTAQEASAIQALFPEVTLLTRREATKSALVRLNAPSILHIASHGFFLGGAAVATAPAAADAARGTTANVPLTNPLLRSGIALAGANEDKSASVLTALEASNLNLWGTKLVTLSACDTGVGKVRNGEGDCGLRRSFFLAGAETLVMSLWPISDYVTREMMTGYYRGLRNGLGRGDALRQAQLALLARQNRRHPYYWASFIQAGDWRPLEPPR
jgi:CHAT domain-containing protein